jgi:hypothetical protein
MFHLLKSNFANEHPKSILDDMSTASYLDMETW